MPSVHELDPHWNRRLVVDSTVFIESEQHEATCGPVAATKAGGAAGGGCTGGEGALGGGDIGGAGGAGRQVQLAVGAPKRRRPELLEQSQ